MKKKLMMSVSALAVVALTMFAGYKTQSSQSTMADLMLDENVEALTAGETQYTFDCEGTTGICAKGIDGNTGHEFIIHGKAKFVK